MFVVTALALVVFASTLVQALWYAPESSTYVPDGSRTGARTVPPSEQPDRLIIPALNIDAPIQYVGITKKGNMGVPSNFSDVAWYKYGTVPGQIGSAVIDGHVDNGLALPGVFKHLDELRVGDDVIVETKQGRKLRFVVTDIESYNYKDVPGEVLFGRADTSRLNLVTCGGSWIRTEKTYDQRLVVYTVLVS